MGYFLRTNTLQAYWFLLKMSVFAMFSRQLRWNSKVDSLRILTWNVLMVSQYFTWSIPNVSFMNKIKKLQGEFYGVIWLCMSSAGVRQMILGYFFEFKEVCEKKWENEVYTSGMQGFNECCYGVKVDKSRSRAYATLDY